MLLLAVTYLFISVWICSLFSYGEVIFMHCVRDWGLNGERSGHFNGEESSPRNHLVTVASHFPRPISLSSSLSLSFILHHSHPHLPANTFTIGFLCVFPSPNFFSCVLFSLPSLLLPRYWTCHGHCCYFTGVFDSNKALEEIT